MTSGIARRRELAQSDPTNHSYQQRRREIIEAAAHVFREKGFRGSSLGDIAAHLKTDRANLYYYVGSKEELFDSAVSEAVAANILVAREIAAAEGSADEKIKTLMKSLMASYSEHFPFLYVFIQEDLRQVAGKRSDWAKRMRSTNREYESILTGLVQQGYDEDSLRDIGPAWVAAFGILGILAWTNRWFDPTRSAVDADLVGEMYAEMIVAGLRAPKSRKRGSLSSGG
jgi:AcrR family transcriptional regulator